MWTSRRSAPEDRRAAHGAVLRLVEPGSTREASFIPLLSAEVSLRVWSEGEPALDVRVELGPRVLALYLPRAIEGVRKDPRWGERTSILLRDVDGDSEPDVHRQPAEPAPPASGAASDLPVTGMGLGAVWDIALGNLAR